jgi:hypothetical protein
VRQECQLSVVEDEPSVVLVVLGVADVLGVLDDEVSEDPDDEEVPEASLEVPELVDPSLGSGDCTGSVESLGSGVCTGSVESLGSGVCTGSVESLGSGDSTGGGTTRPVVDGVPVAPAVTVPVDPPEPAPAELDELVDPDGPVVLVDVPCSRSTAASESRRCAFGSAVARSEGSSAERRWRSTATSEAIVERSFERNAPWRADSAPSAAMSAGEETGRPAS